MSDETKPPALEIAWRPVPTVFAEIALGYSHAAGVSRILLGEVTFNEVPGANLPKHQPVINLAIPNPAIPLLIEYLQMIVEQQNALQ